MTLMMTPEGATHEDPRTWIGGEAAVGPQAEDHVRSQEKHTRGLAVTVLTLAFAGGFLLAGALCRLRHGHY